MKKVVSEGPSQTTTLPQADSAFRVQPSSLWRPECDVHLVEFEGVRFLGAARRHGSVTVQDLDDKWVSLVLGKTTRPLDAGSPAEPGKRPSGAEPRVGLILDADAVHAKPISLGPGTGNPRWGDARKVAGIPGSRWPSPPTPGPPRSRLRGSSAHRPGRTA